MRSVPSLNNMSSRPRSHRTWGWTLPELLVVVLLVAVVILIGTLSVYRGKSAADELACEDQMSAIHSALEIYWVNQGRTYPADQAAFELFLQDRTYFSQEPRCPLDHEQSYHYLYDYDPAINPGPEGITITCPITDSGHSSD
jgi:type II secretory pathway pseudopilin PulG